MKIIITNAETRYLKLTEEARKVLNIFDDPTSDFTIKGARVKYYEKEEEQSTDLYGQIYAIGNIGATKMLVEYEKDPEYFIKHLPELIRIINDMTFETTIIEHTDLDSLDKCISKNLVLKPKKKGA